MPLVCRFVLMVVAVGAGCAKQPTPHEVGYSPAYLHGSEAFQLAGDHPELEPLSREYRTLVSEWLTGDPGHDMVMRHRVARGLQDFEAAAEAPMASEDFAVASGARFLIGSSYLYYAALGLAEQPPQGLAPDEEALYQEAIAMAAQPYRDAQAHAVLFMRSLVDVASASGDRSVWVERAREVLEELGVEETKVEQTVAN